MKNVAKIILLVLVMVVAGLFADVRSAAVPMKIDIAASRMTVKAYKSGVFSGFAHDHEIAAPIASGSVDLEKRTVELQVDVAQMQVLDPKESSNKREEIQKTMLSDRVLDSAKYPTVRFVSRDVRQSASGAYDVTGDLTLHGTTKTVTFAVKQREDVFTGTAHIAQTDFGITPVSVAGGTVKVKDVVDVVFEVRTK